MLLNVRPRLLFLSTMKYSNLIKYRVGHVVDHDFGFYTLVNKLKNGGEFTCSVCSLDEELFPNYFKGSNAVFNLGRKICGCYKTYRWRAFQLEVQLKRKVALQGDEFISLDYKKCYSKFNWICKDGHAQYTSVYNYLHDKSWCSGCNNGVKIDEEDVAIQIRSLGHYGRGSNFYRSGKVLGNLHEWIVDCEFCRSDIVSEKGGRKLFTSLLGNLRAGQLPCRCGRYNYNEDEQEIFVEWFSVRNGYDYIGQDTYEGSNTVFTLNCSRHGDFNIKFSNLESGCHGCSSFNHLGRYFYRLCEEDYLYILKCSDCNTGELFYKIGRSFNVKERLKNYRCGYNIELIYMEKGTHEQIYKREHEIHKSINYREFKYTPKMYFPHITETYTGGILDAIVSFRKSDKVTDEVLIVSK